MREREYKRDIALHVQLLAILMATLTLLATFGMLAGSLILVPAVLGAPFVELDLPESLRASLAGIGGMMLLFVAVNLVIGLGGAIGLQRRRPWGRILGLIDCGISLFFFPFGTIYGIYGLWVLLPGDAEIYVGCCEETPILKSA